MIGPAGGGERVDDQPSEDGRGSPGPAAAQPAAAPDGLARSGGAGGAPAAAFDAADWERRLIAACSVHWPNDPSVALSALMAERDRLEAAGLWQFPEWATTDDPQEANWLWRFEGARRKVGLERMRAGAEAWNAWAAAMKALRHELEQAGEWDGDARQARSHLTRRWKLLADADFADLVLDENAAFNFFAFPGDALFSGATFTVSAWFDGAKFSGEARFDDATFTGEARFDDATFTKLAGSTARPSAGWRRFLARPSPG